jgi:DNA-binding LacI/PurR family transcriptional regulator
MAKRKRILRVAIAYPVAVPWTALFCRGVAEYGQRHGQWAIITSPPTLAGAEEFAYNVHNLRGWHGDGLITAIVTREDIAAAHGLGIPVVNISGAMAECDIPRVMVDHREIGRSAAEHLLAQGFRRLGFCGIKNLWYSRLRAEGFAETATKAGAACDVFERRRQLGRTHRALGSLAESVAAAGRRAGCAGLPRAGRDR